MKITKRPLPWRFGAFLLALLAPLAALAQLPAAPVNGQSPNVAALNNAHSAAAAPYTGTVNVSVPLYTLQVGEVSLPIGLRYAAQGFKPDDQPGWLGMGWSLEAGGVVSRTVQDLPDELTYTGPPDPTFFSNLCPNLYQLYRLVSPMQYAGFYWMPRWAPTDIAAWKADTLGAGSPSAKQQLGERDAICGPCTSGDSSQAITGLENVLDTEPDEFTFSAPGLSGQFVLSHNPIPGQGGSASQNFRWNVQCDRNVRVELLTISSANDNFLIREPWFLRRALGNYLVSPQHRNRSGDSGQPWMFRGFKLTTDDGTRYYFGGDSLAIEYSKPFFQQLNHYWTASAWHLNRIEYPNGQIVRFRYDTPAGAANIPLNLRGTGFITSQFYHTGRNTQSLMINGRRFSADPFTAFAPWQNVDGQVIWTCYLASICESASGATIKIQRGGDPISVGYPSHRWPDIIRAAAVV